MGAHVAAAEGRGRTGTNTLLPRQRFGPFLCRGREFILAHFVAAAAFSPLFVPRQRIHLGCFIVYLVFCTYQRRNLILHKIIMTILHSIHGSRSCTTYKSCYSMLPANFLKVAIFTIRIGWKGKIISEKYQALNIFAKGHERSK